ncbi:MAG: hypothetical protein IPL65_10415 [Lewinellaceae bacterium]|nr:hypothetical protein [Lewinellaceae bacterium]
MAFMLALGFFLVAQQLHKYEMHPHNGNAPACSAAHDGKGTHIHDQRYGADDCALCAFCLRANAVPQMPQLIVPLGAIADRPFCSPVDPCVKTACDSIYQRGPPVL